MITIYEPKETVFTHNGLGSLRATSALVTEELNGVYDIEVIAIASMNNVNYLEEDFVIKAMTPRGYQLFRVYSSTKNVDGTIKLNARHIFYDGVYNNVDSAVGSNLTADAAIKLVFMNTSVGHKFTVSSTISSDIRANLSVLNINPVNAIMRSDSSTDRARAGLIQLFGGELLRDNFDIKLLPTIGADRGFIIKYQKNLTGLDFEENSENIFTRIKPIAKNADDKPLYLPEVYIDSPNVGNYFMPKIGIKEFGDLKVGQNGMTQTDVYAEMRRRVQKLFSEGLDSPFINAKINFLLLSQTVQYANYAHLEEIYLGDTVTTRHDGLNVSLKSRCIKYSYDAILNKYESIELGDFKDNIGSSINRAVTGTSSVDVNLVAHINNTIVHLSESDRAWLDKAIIKYPVT